MAALDWIFAAVLAASLVIGAWRGLVFELLSLAGWVVAFFAAQWFAADVGAGLPMGDADPTWRHVAGFAVVFVGADIPVTGSIGLATAFAGDGLDALLADADAALYRAKHAGRNRVVYGGKAGAPA